LFYRVDYLLAVMLVGLLAGLAFSRITSRFPAEQVARSYFFIVLALIGLRIVCFMGSAANPQLTFWKIAGGAISDLGSLLFGALFGLAARRTDRTALLLEPEVFSALCISTAFGFALAAIGKAFSMDWMIGFFHQSGYSTAFLKCIMITEVFAALAMLIPATVLPAVFALAVDMFGAVYTHIHNGDPLNDSTGAIGSLIHLAIIAALWMMQRPARRETPRRIPFFALGAGGVLCLLIAVAGGILMRHLAHA
jgi:DoxX-like family